MKHKLVIAEKPSVAMSLAAVLGANEKKDGYLEGNGYLVSWCVGHLLELAQSETYGDQYAKWRYGDLPILPGVWKYEVPKDKKKQLTLLCRLMNDKRVDSVVCATDAGREGELIFRLVYEYAGCKKPMNVSGFPVWKTLRSVKVLRTFALAATMTISTMPRYAVPVLTG